MSDPLARWRSRCERAIATGEGLPLKFGFASAVRFALNAAEGESDPVAAERKANAEQEEWTRLSCGGSYHQGVRAYTCWLALQWLREELARETDVESQRRSFAYGNCNIDNPSVTRELVDEVAEELAREEE